MGQVLRQRFTLQGRSVARDVQPVRGVRVTVRGDRDTFHTTTDGAGRYEVPVLPGDSYAISFDPPEGLRIERQWSNRVQVDVYPACVAVDAYARDDGRVNGRLVDVRGKPVPNFPLTLRFSPDATYGGLDLHLRTGVDGRFEFRGVMPARYTLAPSSSLWQREHALPAVGPEAIDVAIAQRMDIGDIALPGAA